MNNDIFELDNIDIKKYLAHRYPFLLVDRVTAIDKEKKYIEGYKNISFNEPIFQGHFPDEAIFPGVMIIESMAQLSGILGFYVMDKTISVDELYVLTRVDGVKFNNKSTPGDRLDMRAELMSQKLNVWKFKVNCKVGHRAIVSSALLTCCVVKKT